MKFCLVGKNDELLFVETNFCLAIPNKKEKYFNVIYYDEKLERRNFKAKRLTSSDFCLTDEFFLEECKNENTI